MESLQRYEVHAAVEIPNAVFLIMVSYSPEGGFHPFAEICCLHSTDINECLYPEDRGSMYLRYVGNYLLEYTVA
jgi:hypothetical protein